MNKHQASISPFTTTAQSDTAFSGYLPEPPIELPDQPIEKANLPQFQARKPKLLWIGDAMVPTGFATVTHSVVEHLSANWNVLVSGINCESPSDRFSYPVIPARRSEDMWGIDSFPELCRDFKPDRVMINNDWWNVAKFVESGVDVPVFAYMPVDGANPNPKAMEQLNQLEAAVWYTDFGWQEATKAGFSGKRHIIPHGTLSSQGVPTSTRDARKRLGLDLPENAFLVGNINRNQPRKRLDLTVDYFASWVRDNRIDDAWLCLHCSHSNEGWDLQQLADYHGVGDRVVFTNGDGRIGSVSEEKLQWIYQALDVQVSTTSGEGWGLTTMEGMSWAIPQVVPDWAALGEWTGESVDRIPCSTKLAHPQINTIGAVPDREPFVEAIDRLYRSPDLRKTRGKEGREWVTQSKFHWKTIARQFDQLLARSDSGTEAATEPMRRAS